jgi:threonine aldolase
MASGLRELPGVELLHPVEANIVLLSIPSSTAAALHDQFEFYDRSVDVEQDRTSIRLVCSFPTTAADVDAFIAAAGARLRVDAA